MKPLASGLLQSLVLTVTWIIGAMRLLMQFFIAMQSSPPPLLLLLFCPQKHIVGASKKACLACANVFVRPFVQP
jgi:hypothetical protein